MRYIGIDFETPLTGPGRQAPEVVVLTAYEKGRKPYICTRDMAGFILERWLSDDNITLVMHNAHFDMPVMQQTYPWLVSLIYDKYEKGLVRCTLLNRIMALIADGSYQDLDRRNSLRLSLAHVAKDALGVDVEGKSGEDSYRFRFGEFIGLPLEEIPEKARDYAKKDAVYPIRFLDVYEAKDPLPDEINQTCYAFALSKMYARGFRADGERVKTLETKLLKNATYYGGKLAQIGLCTWLDKEQRYKDNQKEQRALMAQKCHQAGLVVPRTEPTAKMLEKGITQGNISIKKDYLLDVPCDGTPCSFEDEEVCDNPLHWIAYIKADKGELSKYVKHLKRAVDEPVNSFVSVCKATGRVSVSGPPTQQWPRRPGCRECVKARDGYYLVGADYKANEMVTLAQVLENLFGYSELANLLREGVDVHNYVAAKFLGIGYEEFTTRYKAGDREAKNWRQMTKAENFGFPGGMGPKKFVTYAKESWGVIIDEATARKHKKWWLSVFPEVQLYFDYIGDLCNQGGGVFTVRQPVSGRLRGGVGFCDGCNTHFQGLAADMTKNALWMVSRECFDKGQWIKGKDGAREWVPGKPSPLYGSKPLFFMHDEIILESPISKASAAGDRLAYLMQWSSEIYCPNVPGVAQPWMTTHWYKDAETVRDDQQRLTLWLPS